MVSRFFARVRRVRLASVAVGLVSIALGVLNLDQGASAAKPGGGSKHTSLIYFTANREAENWGVFDTYQMYEDGSGKVPVFTAGVFGMPTSKLYGGDRWWIFKEVVDPLGETSELFASRSDGSQRVQLTDLGFAGLSVWKYIQWSNDGNDSFVSFTAFLNIDGSTYLLRLPIIGDVDALQSMGILPFEAGDCEEILPPEWSGGQVGAGSWSPQSQAITYAAIGATTRSIRVRVLGDPAVDVAIYTSNDVRDPVWSPDGTKIAFWGWDANHYTGVWTINPDGTGLVRVLSGSQTFDYACEGWSWDSKELMLLSWRPNRAVGDDEYNLLRMPARGGRLTVLTRDLPPRGLKKMVRWLPLPP